MLPKLKVLFLCTGNSCRSQMAEGWARAHHGDRLEPYSAGTAPGRVDPRAVQVMREAGVDISGHRSKHLLASHVMEEIGLPLTEQRSKDAREYLGKLAVHHLVVVCARTERECPNPVAVEGSLETRLAAFREVRDGIEQRILDWLRDPDIGFVGARK